MQNPWCGFGEKCDQDTLCNFNKDCHIEIIEIFTRNCNYFHDPVLHNPSKLVALVPIPRDNVQYLMFKNKIQSRVRLVNNT